MRKQPKIHFHTHTHTHTNIWRKNPINDYRNGVCTYTLQMHCFWTYYFHYEPVSFYSTQNYKQWLQFNNKKQKQNTNVFFSFVVQISVPYQMFMLFISFLHVKGLPFNNWNSKNENLNSQNQINVYVFSAPCTLNQIRHHTVSYRCSILCSIAYRNTSKGAKLQIFSHSWCKIDKRNLLLSGKINNIVREWLSSSCTYHCCTSSLANRSVNRSVIPNLWCDVRAPMRQFNALRSQTIHKVNPE